jgi:hypothetical protein
MPSKDTLQPGDQFGGLLIDGEAGTPHVVAQLRYDADLGVIVEVPYDMARPSDQFGTVQHWFEDDQLPAQLLFRGQDADVSLFGCHSLGQAMDLGRGLAIGRFWPSEALLHFRETLVAEPFAATTLSSAIDGFAEWSGLRAIEPEPTRDAEGRVQGFTITVASPRALTWKSGDAAMELRIDWSVAPSASGLSITEPVIVESRFPDSRSFSDHFAEHEKVRHLVEIMFGCTLYYRRHRAQDGHLIKRTLGGTIADDRPRIDLVTRTTWTHASRPEPDRDDLQWPIARLGQLDEGMLEAWANSYAAWERAIVATTASFAPHRFLEDAVVNLAECLEAAGLLIGPVAGEEQTYRGLNPTTATNIYRCVISSGVPLHDAAESRVGLARAIAHNYNGIKHPRGITTAAKQEPFPDGLETFLVKSMASQIARATIARNVNPDGHLVDAYVNSWPLQRQFELVAKNGLFITNEGRFMPVNGQQ